MKNKSFIIFFLFVFCCLGNTYAQKETYNQISNEIDFIHLKIQEKEFELAQELINKMEKYDLDKESDLKLKLNYHQAQIHYAKEQDSLAIKLLLEGFSELQYVPDSELYILYVSLLSDVFKRAKNYQSAEDYIKLGVFSAINRNDSLSISKMYLSLGHIKNIEQSVDSAAYYYRKSIYISPRSINANETLSEAYSSLIETSIKSEHYNLAERYSKDAFEIFEEKKDTLKMVDFLSNLGKLKLHIGDYEESNKFYVDALLLIDNTSSVSGQELKFDILKGFSELFYIKGNYEKAYNFLLESITIEQNLIKNYVENKITEIEAKYKVAENEKYAQIQKNKRQRAEIWMIILGVASIILLGLLWLIYHTNNLKREQISLEFEKEKLKQTRELEKIKNESQLKILNATLDGKEQERRHIAEILHDNVSALLSSAHMHLYAVKLDLKEKSPEEVNKIDIIISEASEKIRDLSHQLISSVLMKFGLPASIEDMCEKFSNSQLVFDSDAINIGRYDINFESIIHMIIEELINNILKHSQASKASINIEEINKAIEIRISDNGVGFDTDEIISKDGLGLSHIGARVNNLKGEFDIKSQPNKGTRIFISIPIPN